MNFPLFAGHQTDPSARVFACVDHANLVTRVWIEARIVHAQRSVVKRFRVIPPGAAASTRRAETDDGALTVYQVRLARCVTEVVIKAAGSRISPVQDFVDPRQALGFGGKLA